MNPLQLRAAWTFMLVVEESFPPPNCSPCVNLLDLYNASDWSLSSSCGVNLTVPTSRCFICQHARKGEPWRSSLGWGWGTEDVRESLWLQQDLIKEPVLPLLLLIQTIVFTVWSNTCYLVTNMGNDHCWIYGHFYGCHNLTDPDSLVALVTRH